MYNVQLEWITPSPRGLGDDRGAEIEQLVSGSPRSREFHCHTNKQVKF
jgi:hypothetical protein